MSATEDTINNLNVAKLMLCNPQMLNPEMCIKIGLAITDAIALLKEQDNCENCAIAIEDRQLVVRCKDCKHLFDGEHTKNCCEVLMEKAGWLKEISVSPDWFCADGEKDGGQTKRPKETFWDSLSEADLMEPMHHFED